jgi:MFS superfamily sulfate permease-like transporter
MTMTSTTLTLTFVCGVAVGMCLAFILMTIVSARRRRHFGVPSPYTGSMVANQELARQQAEQWRRDNPMELDQ